MATTNNKSDNEQVLEFIKMCFRHWYYFIGCGLICAIVGVIYYKTVLPVVSVKAQVAIRHDESLSGSITQGQSGGILNAIGLKSGSENIEDETLILSSHGNIRTVVQNLGLNKYYTEIKALGLNKKQLYEQSPIVLVTAPALADTLGSPVIFDIAVKKDGSASAKIKYGKIKLGVFPINAFPTTINTSVGSFTLQPSEYAGNYQNKNYHLRIFFSNYDYMAEVYKTMFDIDFYKKSSDLILMSMDTENAYMAKKLLLSIIDVYNTNWRSNKNNVYEKTVAYIDERLGHAKVDLIDADLKIQQFKDKNQLTDIEADVKYYYTMSAGIQQSLLELKSGIAALNTILDFLNDPDNRYSPLPFIPSSSNDALANVIEKYNERLFQITESNKNQSRTTLSANMENLLTVQRNTVINSIKQEKESQLKALQNVEQKDREIAKKLGNIPLAERDYMTLARNQELQQAIYMFLLEKREELAIHSASLLPKLKIIDDPYVSNKLVSPNRMKVALMVLFFGGMVFPLLLIYCVPLLSKKKK
ncbi:MAG: hypothetical protein LBR66_01185 [Candidatus Symbiothrix sp.]|nr:hypothetical protein [Candidatus Symbiothrix sp.]